MPPEAPGALPELMQYNSSCFALVREKEAGEKEEDRGGRSGGPKWRWILCSTHRRPSS